jgi:hypothetical protein
MLCAQRRSNKYQFYSLWFDPTEARTHDLPHWRHALSFSFSFVFHLIFVVLSVHPILGLLMGLNQRRYLHCKQNKALKNIENPD